MRFTCEVYIKPRKDILDPQGDAVKSALANLSFDGVSDVKVGRYLLLVIDGKDETAVHKSLEEMCEKLLANPITEDFTLKVTAQ